MAAERIIARLGGWEGYEVAECVQQQRGAWRWCVVWLRTVAGVERRCAGCGAGTRAVHDVVQRRVRDLPLFEYRVELVVPRVRVACTRCGPKLERLEWLAPYARLTRRLAESVAHLCRVASILHVACFFDLDWKTVKACDCTSLIEGINNKIKVIKRIAYGFRDDAYFLKIRAAFPGVGQ